MVAIALCLIVGCASAKPEERRGLQPPFDEIIPACDSMLFPGGETNEGITSITEEIKDEWRRLQEQDGVVSTHKRFCEDKDVLMDMGVQVFESENAARVYFSGSVEFAQKLGGETFYSKSCCNGRQATPCPCNQQVRKDRYSHAYVNFVPRFYNHQPDEAFIYSSEHLLGGRKEDESAAEDDVYFRVGRYIGHYRVKEIDPGFFENLQGGWDFGLSPAVLVTFYKSIDTTIQRLQAMP